MENDKKITSLDQAEPMVPITPEQKQELAQLREQFNRVIVELMNTEFHLSQVYPETEDLGELYEQLSDLKKCLDSFRPFNPTQVAHLREIFDTEYTYESNAIEGNSLTLSETQDVLRHGLTISGKPMKDHLEAINHQEAIEYLRELVQNEAPFSERALLDLHEIILRGIDRENAGRLRRNEVFIIQRGGGRHNFPKARLVFKLVEDYFIFYEENKGRMHPVQLAAQMHQRLVNIHPFIDGNGRTARLVMNLILQQAGYPITILESEHAKRFAYYDALTDFHKSGNYEPFELLIAQYVKKWCFQYLDILSGDISEHGEDKGYYYFKKIEPYLPQGK